MFSTLYDTVFPFLGEFFGKLTAFASLSLRDFFDMTMGNFNLFNYTNLFTGQSTSHSIYITDTVKFLIAPVRWLMQALFAIEGVPFSTPLWAAFLLASIMVTIVIGFFRFVLSAV